MTIKLNKNQFDYLINSLSEEKETLRLKMREVSKENQSFLIEIDENGADRIRDWASAELQKTGFDINYKLTKNGKILEEIIDLFYIE